MAGVSVLSLCEKGDAYIAAETGKIFKKEKEMKKGQHVAALSSSVSRVFLRSWFKPLNPSLCPPPLHHRYRFSYLCVGEQLRLPFLSFEERPGHHSEGRGPCQNVSTYATALTCLFSPVFVFPKINMFFIFSILLFPASVLCNSYFTNHSFVLSDLGVHVDGFISNVAHSFIVGVTKVCLLSTHLVGCSDKSSYVAA